MRDFKWFRSSVFAAALMVIGGGITSCSSDGDYESMIPVRADIVGAESLIIYSGDGSRADNGKFVEAGLYKVDKDGNVSAVGIFLKKNGSTKEESLSYQPHCVRNCGETYVLLAGSFYRGKRWGYGDDPVMSKTMLVNKKTGRIYELADRAELYVNGAEITPNKVIVWGIGIDDKVGQIVISGDNATYTERGYNDRYRGFYGIFPGDEGIVDELPNGTILSQNYELWDIGFLFPNGGYDYLKDVLGVEERNLGGLILNNGCAAMVQRDYGMHLQWYNVNVGNQQGQIEVELVDELPVGGFYKYMGYYETAEHIIAFGYIFDKTTKKLKPLDVSISSDNICLRQDRYFAGRMWNVLDREAYWFNPETLESGSFSLNLDGIDVTSIEPYYTAGKVVIYGTRRSDSSSVVATVNLATEKTEILFTPPTWATFQLIPLN
ncbi:MAG: hypothetical protein K2K76_03140 [Muribaculaceae bacterium]|nr:hypothetical protein [Muribaculaceae bacterium]